MNPLLRKLIQKTLLLVDYIKNYVHKLISMHMCSKVIKNKGFIALSIARRGSGGYSTSLLKFKEPGAALLELISRMSLITKLPKLPRRTLHEKHGVDCNLNYFENHGHSKIFFKLNM